MNWGMRVLQTLALPLGYVTIGQNRSDEPLLMPFEAGDETRTRYLHLGKVALYRMSYTRIWCLRPESNWRHADFQSAALPTELPRHGLGWDKAQPVLYDDPEQTRTVDLQRDRLAC